MPMFDQYIFRRTLRVLGLLDARQLGAGQWCHLRNDTETTFLVGGRGAKLHQNILESPTAGNGPPLPLRPQTY